MDQTGEKMGPTILVRSSVPLTTSGQMTPSSMPSMVRLGKRLAGTGGPVECSLTAIGSDGTVYVGSGDTKLYAISQTDKKWEFQTGDAAVQAPLPPSD